MSPLVLVAARSKIEKVTRQSISTAASSQNVNTVLGGVRLHPNRPVVGFVFVLMVAAFVVATVSLTTNHMQPEWDMDRYIDMARNGIVGNRNLVAPYAYIPGAPLLIGAIAHALVLDTALTFRACGYLMSVGFIVACFYFARFLGATFDASLYTAIALSLYFYIVKWTLFAGTMVDIYAYPLILVAFAATLRGRFYLCAAICAIGLFFREFLLLPLMMQAAAVAQMYWRTRWRKVFWALSVTGLIIVVSVIIPRLLIHTSRTVWDIDPINDPSSLLNLFLFPASKRRDFNIVFAYLSCWLPLLLLMDKSRLRLLWSRLEPYRVLVAWYLIFHFALVMWGGMNLCIFVTYSLPVQIMALVILLDEGKVQAWEKILVIIALVTFNRILINIPLPQEHLDTYLQYYGGFHKLVTARSLWRFAELLGWISGFWLLRQLRFHPLIRRSEFASRI